MKKRLLLLLASGVLGCSTPDLTVYLSDVDLSVAGNTVKINQSMAGKPLSMDSVHFDKGVGIATNCALHVKLDGRGGTFSAFVGVDDHSQGNAVADFYVFTNKGVAFCAEHIQKGTAPKAVEVDLDEVTDLYLLAHSESSQRDGSDWADAKFVVYSAPTVVKDSAEAPYILTPPPAPAPRINGAKIVGASASKPFLFTVAATGERPMRFSATGLPEGLSLNDTTGVITGACPAEGRYAVSVMASNAKGSCSDTIEIVIGGGLALTPHMGWNSWYIYQLGITQEIMEQSAKAIHDEGLINYGYAYVNIDDGWEVKANSDDPVVGGAARNRDGSIRTNKNFPDMRRMTDYIHSLGLKAGLYSSPGRTTCGGYTASFGYEAQDVRSFADWGFDFLKYDWCSYGQEAKSKELPKELPELQKPYLLISKLLKEAPRDIVLNICQYGWGDVWKWGKEVGGNSWRTTGDLGWNTQDNSGSMFRIGFFQEKIREYSGPDGWNDPDYLLFGKIYDWNAKAVVPAPYSPSEHYTCMTLWCMLSAPLIFSGEVIGLNDFTRNVLCNAEVIDIDQDKRGEPAYCVSSHELIDIWKKDLHDGTSAIAIFNRRPLAATVEVDWSTLGYNGAHQLRDLWRQQDMGTTDDVDSFEIPRHGCILFKIVN